MLQIVEIRVVRAFRQSEASTVLFTSNYRDSSAFLLSSIASVTISIPRFVPCVRVIIEDTKKFK
jgi:hypothetical protein